MKVEEVIKLAKEYESLKQAQEEAKKFIDELYGYESFCISTDDESFHSMKVHVDYKEEFTDFLKGYNHELGKQMAEVEKKLLKE